VAQGAAAALMLVAMSGGATWAGAQRAPVLRQIALPHPYYYREMYLPQATSGPSSATWSPDGTTLIYSMQGTLWRQRVGSDSAEQLTDGPGYDYQPDWSPDGRSVVYSSYRGDAEELYVLDLASGTSRALTSGGAVNVEPRWSPDGARIAFVSTRFSGRFHLFVVRAAGDSAPRRLSADHASALPRYYYSGFDHYLSPTWSPDGRELLYVGNRGHVWGTGGIWRARVDLGAADGDGLIGAREIRDEETTWRARPDWSRDGRRVVYSSYLGQQWHQLWLMPADGANPLQLTYGAFDASAPRWSPDGTRIAYIVNAGGNTALRVIALPGGRVMPIVAVHRRYRSPVGVLALTLSAPARVSITGPDGRAYTPDDAWRHADDAYDRRDRRLEIGYFHAQRRAVVPVPAGALVVQVTRGLEYRVVTRAVTVAAGDTVHLAITLDRLADLPADGWTSGDLHVHMNYGGTYRNDPAHLVTQARAEDLHVVESLIVNKEGRVPDASYFTGRVDPASDRTTLLVHGQEYHTSYWGHTGLLGLSDHLLWPGYAGYTATAAASLVPTNADVAALAHAQGALAGYVHPFDTDPDPTDAAQALTDELPVDVALGTVDYMEIVGFSDHLATAHVWYRLLDCGFRIPAGAGTDAMANFASLRGPVGLNRVYAYVGAAADTGGAPGDRAPLDHARWLAALRAGRTFATNGPLLTMTVDGHAIGDSVRYPAGARTLDVRATLRSIVPVDHFELVANGRVIDSVVPVGARTTAQARWTVPVTGSGWYTVRAYSDHATPPIMDIYPFATTSPVYVTLGGAPVRSRADATYFLAWIARLDAGVRAFGDWRSDEERASVLAQLGAARAEFERRLAEPDSASRASR